jgi:hypothetical protein
MFFPNQMGTQICLLIMDVSSDIVLKILIYN